MPPSAPPARERALVAALLLYPLVSAFLIPAFVIPMRQRLEREMPSEWAAVANDGSFQYASPYVTGSHLGEMGSIAMKVRQVALHGRPYDPYTGDRSLGSWVFNCLNSFALAFFWLFTGGREQWGMVLAAGGVAALRGLSFYLLFMRVLRDRSRAALGAFLALFFADALAWGLAFFYAATAAVFTFDFASPLHSLARLPRCLFNPMWVQEYARLPSVGLTVLGSFWLLAGAHALAVSAARRTGAALLLGLAFGLFGFSHFYEWSLAVGSVAVFALLGPWAGLAPAGLRNIRWTAAAAAGASAGYAAWAWAFTAGTRGSIIHRLGEAPAAHPGTLAYLLFAAWMFREGRRRPEVRALWTLWAAVELAVFALCWSPWVLGFDLQFVRHYHMQANLLMGLALLCRVLREGAPAEFARVHALVLCAAVAAWDVAANKSYAEKYFKLHGAPRAVEASMRWLAANAPEGSLVVTPSYAGAMGVPLWTAGRIPVTHFSPTAGHPAVTSPENLAAMGRMLAAAGVDVERFLRERWLNYHSEETLDERQTFYTRNSALAQRERTEWPYFLIGEALTRPGALEEAADVVRRGAAAGAPLPRPYYLWLGGADAGLLAGTPESRGGRAVYDAPGARLYLFE